MEGGDGESAEDTVSIGGPDEKGEGNTEDAVGSGEESSQDGNDGTADDSKSPDEVKDNSSPDSESSLEVSIPDGESFDDEEGLSDPYAGEDTPVSVTPLYGSPQNSSGPRRAPARASGTITTGLDMGYNRKWMAEFAPYSSAVEKFFNGQPAYCVEPHKGAPGAGTLSMPVSIGQTTKSASLWLMAGAVRMTTHCFGTPAMVLMRGAPHRRLSGKSLAAIVT